MLAITSAAGDPGSLWMSLHWIRTNSTVLITEARNSKNAPMALSDCFLPRDMSISQPLAIMRLSSGSNGAIYLTSLLGLMLIAMSMQSVVPVSHPSPWVDDCSAW